MINKIKTLLKPKLIYPFNNNSKSLDDFVDIEKKLNIDINLIDSDEQLIELLLERFKEISDKDTLRLNIYQRTNKENNLWTSFTDEKEWQIIEKNNNNEKSDSSLYKSIFYKKSKTMKKDEESEMILLQISENHLYLIELNNRKKHALLYYFFITQLTNLINSYLLQKRTNTLVIKNKSYENKLNEAWQNENIAQKAMKRKVYELHNLVEASNEIYSILELKQLINSALLTIIGQVGFQQAFMLLFNKQDQKFNKIYQKGFGNIDLKGIEIEVTSPLVTFFLKHRTPMYLSRIEQNDDLRYYADILKEFGVFLVAPLVYAERLQGIVCAGEKMHFRSFSESDFEIFHILINIISISIGNAYLFQDVKNLSLTDAMTNLHNYRYFEGRLKEEINRAIRHGDKVSLMILDIDYFKNYNDTLGHQAGDTVLRKMGNLLKNIIRDEDIVARYGGEEFCIILPGIHKEGISSLGERVRASIESEQFYKEEVQPGGKITISLGIATFPDDAKDFTDLVENADKALYQAKNLGRNQVRVFQPIQ